MVKGLIADIEHASTHDGPGVRTTVFLKGCPLACKWCHNPECISPQKQELFYKEKCIGCGKCSEGCFAGARVVCGKDMTPGEVLADVLQDRAYYADGGGVTFSGGEPLMQREFLLETLKLCKKHGLNTAIETSMYRFDEEILSLCDCIMADIKVLDSAKHKEYTGVGNEAILENIIRADRLNKPMILRTPVIKGINDSIENIKETSGFVKGLKNAVQYELLPYHPLGLTKAEALGIKQERFEKPDNMEELNKYAFVR